MVLISSDQAISGGICMIFLDCMHILATWGFKKYKNKEKKP
jgi:hypothetical protein